MNIDCTVVDFHTDPLRKSFPSDPDVAAATRHLLGFVWGFGLCGDATLM